MAIMGKRFDNSLNPFIEKFNASIRFDKHFTRFRLLDCSCKNAWQNKVLSSSEALQIINGLETIKLSIWRVNFLLAPRLKIFITV